MNQREIKILHLYPDLLNLYGDKGNISALTTRLSWRDIDVQVTTCTKEETPDFSWADILFLGGGSEKEEKIVFALLKEKKEELKAYIEDGGVMLATCGGFPMLGRYEGQEKGLEILDITTRMEEARLIGNVVVKTEAYQTVVGFANHGERTEIGGYMPLGKAVAGPGNTGEKSAEGLLYKNLIATYLHGPLLPKNPKLCDDILARALAKKYPDFAGLSPLPDVVEEKANAYIAETYGKE